ncbi:hypothetical protein FB45DRAFT_1057001 [Roridomyces roridus]|uniref:Malate dehydrogenase n=1 Tax=Roridomyces roridus TaxID=1738132 RepID=A0AAD7FRI2_9AGAR|nr:hypothetical protein FB45DRAFT_1057001 [Roridomyces roridus]
MMFKLSLLCLLSSSIASASALLHLRDAGSRCDLTNAEMNLPLNQSVLIAPSVGPSYIGVAVGVQNYTCTASTGTWTNVGAVAELFDISCLYGEPEFLNMSQIAYQMWELMPPTEPILNLINYFAAFRASMVLGQHYFVQSPTVTGLSPKWDFTSASLAGHADAFVIGAKAGDMPSPNGPSAVDWLMLNNVQGSLAKQVFRINTVGGMPPTSCAPGANPISVKYASAYWLFNSTVSV